MGHPGGAANSDEAKSGSRGEFKRSLEGRGNNFVGRLAQVDAASAPSDLRGSRRAVARLIA